MSPNFDSFERLLREALVLKSEGKSIDSQARRFALIADERRPKQFKGISEGGFSRFIFKAHDVLAAMLGGAPRLETSNDNREGKDLLDLRSGRTIELKSGESKTDAQVGVESISWAFTGASNEALAEILIGSMKRRRRMFASGAGHERLIASKVETNDALDGWFTKAFVSDAYDPDRLADYLHLMSHGVTKLDEIKKGGSGVVFPLLLECDLEKGLVSYRYAFDVKDGIHAAVLRAKKDGRVTCRVVARATGCCADIYPHYKNSYKGDGVKIPAKYWVETACFHVWFRNEAKS